MKNKFVAKIRKKAESMGNDEVHMIMNIDLRRELEDVGAATTTKEWNIILTPLKMARTGEIDYR